MRRWQCCFISPVWHQAKKCVWHTGMYKSILCCRINCLLFFLVRGQHDMHLAGWNVWQRTPVFYAVRIRIQADNWVQCRVINSRFELEKPTFGSCFQKKISYLEKIDWFYISSECNFSVIHLWQSVIINR